MHNVDWCTSSDSSTGGLPERDGGGMLCESERLGGILFEVTLRMEKNELSRVTKVASVICRT